MKRILLFCAAIACGSCCLVAGKSTSAQQTSLTGKIEGVVIYESDRKRPWRYRRYYVADRKQGHLAEAVVALVEAPLTSNIETPAHKTWTIDQKDYRFIPETLAVRAGDRVTFTNSDPVLHDVTTRQQKPHAIESLTQNSFSLRQRQEVSWTYSNAGGIEAPVTLTCRFHSSMRGWIYVFDHSFYQVTEREGEFRLEGIPAGKHKLAVLHAAGGLRWEQEIEVKAGQTQRFEIRVSADNLITKEKR